MNKKICKYIIELLNSAIKNIPCNDIPNGVTWQEIYDISQAHKISNIIGYGLNNVKNVPLKVRDVFYEMINMSIVVETQQSYEIEQIFEAFDNEQIAHMPLKGYIMKNLYPSPDMRTMSDVDILIKREDSSKCKKIMNEKGYDIAYSNSEEDAYTKAKTINIEMHKQLVGYEHSAYNKYYRDGWDFAKHQKNSLYLMSDEDFYIYHIVHLAKHYKVGGAGIRFILDIYIFLKDKKNSLDWQYINDEFSKLKLLEFSKRSLDLSEMWFGEGKEDSILNEMEDFICQSGTFGTQEVYEITQNEKYKGSKRIIKYLNVIFPPQKIMSGLYPIAENKPWLIPVLWIHRIFKKIVNCDESIKDSLHFSKSNSEIKAEQVISHLENIGLN